MRQAKAEAWVVYRMPVKGHVDELRAVCEQEEDVMERNRPGYYTLIQANLTNECEAEKLRSWQRREQPARKNAKRQLPSWPGGVAVVLSGPDGPLAI